MSCKTVKCGKRTVILILYTIVSLKNSLFIALPA